MALTNLSFYSNGLKLAAYLSTPEDWKPGDPPRPAILCPAGYSGNTQTDVTHMVARLTTAGYFCLAIDYQGFGESEGQRGRHRPLEQAQNMHDALSLMQTIEGIDPSRLAIYGTSFGGANGIWVAAHDERVKVLVTSVAVTHGERWMRLIRRPWEWQAFKEQVEAHARERVKTGQPESRPMTDILLRDPHSQWVREQHIARGANYVMEYDLESAEAVFRYRPEWVVDRISPRPVLFIYAEHDGLVEPTDQLSCYEKCGEPKKLVKLPKAHHYDSYEFVNPEMAALVLRETLEWFGTYL
ncbi:MAG: alpha/beta fold hydrolase [Chloroflexi bacterium]|nr:alpha/beta fold hydrolase [Chloroflexota bacterium]